MDVVLPVAAAFRFYDDDAGEAASSPLGNQDANVSINVSSGNVAFQLRYRVQNAAAVNGATTDDYTLQRSHQGGAYSTVNGSTVITASASGLTNDNATTNRATNGITDGTGSFVAGEQCTDGSLDNHQLTASNFTEHVWGCTVVAADVANGDTIDFRIAFNGGSPGMTNSVTPRITVVKMTTHATSGAIVGPGTTVAGSAAHIAIHTTTGAISGPGASVVGSAAHIAVHDTTGAVEGPGAVVSGSATRFRAHATTGEITGPGAEVAGSASRASAAGEEVVTVKTGTGGIDRKRKTIFKPTGLDFRKRKTVEERVQETREIHQEVIQAKSEFKPIPLMTEAEINREIGFLMREVQRKQDEEDESVVLLLLMLS